MASIFLAGLVFFAALFKGAHDLWAATLSYCVILVLAGSIFVKSRKPTYFGILIPILIVITVFSISFWNAVNPSESLLELLDWFCAILLFFVSIQLFREPGTIKKWILIMIPLFWILLFIPQPLINPNILTGFLLFWIPVFIYQVLQKPRQLFWLGGLVPALIGFALCRSLWGWACLFLGAALWFSVHKKNIFTLLFGLGAVGVLAGLNFESAAIQDRIVWWKAGAAMVSDFPWFGVGLGNFPSAFLAYENSPTLNTLFPHNYFIGLLSETGFIGIMSVMLLFAGWLQIVIKNKNQIKERLPFVYGVGLSLLFSLFHIGLEYFINLMMLGIFAGITIAPFLEKNVMPRLSVKIVAVALIFISIPYIVSPFRASQNVIYAQHQMDEKKYDEAITTLSLAADLDPLSFEAQRGLAKSYFLKGDRDKAILHQQKALQLNKLSPELMRELSVYSSLKG